MSPEASPPYSDTTVYSGPTEKFFFLGYREDAHSMPANANKDPRQVPAVSLFCKAALNSWGAILP